MDIINNLLDLDLSLSFNTKKTPFIFYNIKRNGNKASPFSNGRLNRFQFNPNGHNPIAEPLGTMTRRISYTIILILIIYVQL